MDNQEGLSAKMEVYIIINRQSKFLNVCCICSQISQTDSLAHFQTCLLKYLSQNNFLWLLCDNRILISWAFFNNSCNLLIKISDTVVTGNILCIISLLASKYPFNGLRLLFTHLLIVSTAHFFLAAFRRPKVPRHQDWIAIAKNTNILH